MPKEFSYSSFTLTPQDDENLKYIDFTILPVDLISAVRLDYINRPQIADNIDRFILKYLVLFPLRVACSLEVLNRDVPFIEEYIFPQQLILWVRENNNFNGILYRTSSAIPKARDWNYV